MPEHVIGMPAHPRLRKALEKFELTVSPNIRLIAPVEYLDMIALITSAALVLTDSGGLQKEAYILRIHTVTLRDDTEWVETVSTGWNRLVGSTTKAILAGVAHALQETLSEHPDLYGDGHTSEKIISKLAELTPLSG